MAPEQAAADPHLDHRVDIYALGVLAYELLTGRTPFSGRTPQETLAAHVMQTPEPVSRLRPGISPAFEALVMKCLAKRPADRFQSADELVSALEPLATPSGGMTPTYTQPVTGVAPTGRRGGSGLVRVAALVIVLGSAGMLSDPAGRQRTRTDARPRPAGSPARRGSRSSRPFRPTGSSSAYVAATMDGAKILLQPTDGGRAVNITDSLPGAQISPAWAPDGRRLVFVSFDQTGVSIVTMPPTGGDVRRLHRVDYDGGFRWRRSGRRMGTASRSSRVTASSPWRRTAAGSPCSPGCEMLIHWLGPPTAAGWPGCEAMPSSCTPAAASATWRQAPSSSCPPMAGPPVMVSDSTTLNVSPAWLPGGRELLYLSSGGGGRDIYQQSIGRGGRAVGPPRRVTTGLDAHTFALSPDGKRLAYSKYTRDLNVWMVRLPATGSVNARSAVPITRGNQASEVMRLSPDGKWLVYDSDLNGNGDLFIVPSEGGTPRQLTDDPADDLAPDWSPDGTEIAFHSFRTGNRDVFTIGADGSGLAQVTSDTLSDWYAAWGPDDNTLAFSRGDGGDLTIVETRRPSKSAPWGPTAPLGKGIATDMTLDRSAYIHFQADSVLAFVAIPSGGGASTTLYRPPRWFDPNWIRMGPDGRTLYVFSSDSVGDPAYWAVDLRTKALRKVVTFDHSETRAVRGVFDTDGSRFYFVAGEHQADIWVADVEEK